MKWEPATNSGKLLWQLLPAVYRNLDGTFGKDPKRPNKPLRQRGDLANYLDAYGVLLDQVKNTILQRLGDTSPETCQEWLIPYFADLLDVHLVSPDIEGQRMEVARAISWRQRKGTIGCINEIAREVGRYEKTVPMPVSGSEQVTYQSVPTVVVQEGFQRVATTARIDTPLPSLYSLGLTQDVFDISEPAAPIRDAKRPGLTAGTIDFRYLSRAEEVPSDTPVSQAHAFNGEGKHWQQLYPGGMPCEPNTYQDVSVRTVDVRCPGWNHGHYHPHRTLLYTAPREGLFSTTQFEVSWDSKLWLWFELFNTTDGTTVPFNEREENKVNIFERILPLVYHNSEILCLIERRRFSLQGPRQRVVGIQLPVAGTNLYHRKERVGENEYLLRSGFEIREEKNLRQQLHVTLRGFGDETPCINNTDINLSNIFHADQFLLEDIGFKANINIEQACVQVYRSAFAKLDVESPSTELGPTAGSQEKILSISDSLIQDLHLTGEGGCRMEYCTVLKSIDCKNLEVSDSILLDTIVPDTFNQIYMRYSALPGLAKKPVEPEKGRIYEDSITRKKPIFMSEVFGESGCGVLHPASDIATRQGAEDGGEMGAYHHRHYVLREQAIVDKLKEFLPVTQQPVLIVHREWLSPVQQPENQPA